MDRRTRSDAVARWLFLLSLLLIFFAWGGASVHYDVVPLPWLRSARVAVAEIFERTGVELPWYYVRAETGSPAPTVVKDAMQPGLTLVGGVGRNDQNLVRIVDAEGHIIHQWVLDWFKIWPDAEHLPADVRPKSNGGLVHGVLLLPTGDLVFNFSELGMVRMDPCGSVQWRLPYRTHHTVNRDDDGNFWVPVLRERREPLDSIPNYLSPFSDFGFLRLTPEGKIIDEVSVFDLLLKNGRVGLLYLSSTSNRTTDVSGDTMHLNDVEVFPDSLPQGVFRSGDVMISLRNINAVIVFDPNNWEIKFESIGQVLRQHDPDFVDGNTISVFDNNNLSGPNDWEGDVAPHREGLHSHIVSLNAATGDATTIYGRGPEEVFFTDIMGEHQRLPNGNLLLVESISGRVFEVDASGQVVWEFLNIVEDGVLGLVSDAQRLPADFDVSFFVSAAASCGDRSG